MSGQGAVGDSTMLDAGNYVNSALALKGKRHD
jgi:isoaspartyl peptidase/L-asparaginase-like protein (Ntn-hydrolase superfamily)